MATKEWERLSCENGLRGERFTDVSHTSHINTSLEILATGEVLASLVCDESILRGRDVWVSWFSPNVWYVGYRYGTVRFSFNFTEMVANKSAYWVEIAQYEIKAPRILIGTDGGLGLELFDPTLGNGPWGVKNGEHTYRTDACLEILMNEAVSLDLLTKIDFVDHHPDYCAANRINPTVCPELGMTGLVGSGKFLAGVLARHLDIRKYENAVGHGFQQCLVELIRHADDATYSGTLLRRDPNAEDEVRAFCRCVHEYRSVDANIVAGRFSSDKEFVFALAGLCAREVSEKYFTEFLPRLHKWYGD